MKEQPKVTVTHEDLVRLDEAIQQAVSGRRKFPGRLSTYLEKILEHKIGEVANIEVDDLNLSSVTLEDKEPQLTSATPSSITVQGEEPMVVTSRTYSNRLDNALSVARILEETVTKPQHN